MGVGAVDLFRRLVRRLENQFVLVIHQPVERGLLKTHANPNPAHQSGTKQEDAKK